MSYCNSCLHKKPVKVPTDPFGDPAGERYGFTETRLCTAGKGDSCPAEKDMTEFCPTCGYEISNECLHCLNIQMMVAEREAERRAWEREALANS